MKRITAKVEPEMLAKAMLRGEDDTIRTTDLPERQQLQPSQDPKDWKDPSSNVLAECARWGHLPSTDIVAKWTSMSLSQMLAALRCVAGLTYLLNHCA